MENRTTLIIPEKKKKIENIKKKYKNMQMSDTTAEKIEKLDITNKILKTATLAAGVITVIDIFTPDPVFMLDEAALAAITGLLKTSSTIVENKISELAKQGETSTSISEINEITNQIKNVKNAVKKSRNK